MKNKRPRTESLPIDDILKIHTESELSTFIIGHLLVEALLVRLIDSVMPNPELFNPESSRFPQKVSLCNAIGLINIELSKYLNILNEKRNEFAHNLQHHITFEETVKLAQDAKRAGVKFDNEDFEGYSKFKYERMNISYLLHDIFFNMAWHLADIIIENGGEEQFVRNEF